MGYILYLLHIECMSGATTHTYTYTSQSYYSIYGIVYTVDQVHSTAPGGSATGRITCTVSYKLFTV